MTHEELLEKINRYSLRTSMLDTLGWNALRVVVEFHKPFTVKDEVLCEGCCQHVYLTDYPCPTIQAIEKRLG